jgi:hypothetical protein
VTSIVPNRSIVVGKIVSTDGKKAVVAVDATRPALPRIADLAAGRAELEIANVDGAAGDQVEIECAVEPIGPSGVGFVATKVTKVTRG